MTHFSVSGSFRLGGRDTRQGHGAGSGVVGVEEFAALPVGKWSSRDCMSKFGHSSCVGLAGVRGDIGTGAWIVIGSLGAPSVVCVDLGVCGGGTGGRGCGHRSALLVGGCEANC